MRTVRVSVGEIAVCVSLPSSSNNASLAESVVAVASTGAIGDDKVAEAKGTRRPARSIFAVVLALHVTNNTRAVRISIARIAPSSCAASYVRQAQKRDER
jgi:hypothetical protein